MKGLDPTRRGLFHIALALFTTFFRPTHFTILRSTLTHIETFLSTPCGTAKLPQNKLNSPYFQHLTCHNLITKVHTDLLRTVNKSIECKLSKNVHVETKE